MRRILLSFLLFFTAAVYAEGGPPADTFLYRLSKAGRPVSYLLGTIHVGKTGAALPAAYRETLAKTAQLVVETDEEAMSEQEVQQMMLMMHDTRTLKQSLGNARIRRLQKILDRGQEPAPFDADAHIKPWAFWISTQSLFNPKGYSYRYGIDNLLIQQAKQQGKAVIALEGAGQLDYFADLPEPAVIRSLDSFERHHRAFLNDIITLETDYRRQRARKIWAEISDPAFQLKYLPAQDRKLWHEFMYGKLLTERNQKWLPRLIEILPQKPTLVAVGSAHLFGTQGLIVRLRQVGYRVEPVEMNIK